MTPFTAAKLGAVHGSMIVVVNLLVDILYAVVDPRIRLEA